MTLHLCMTFEHNLSWQMFITLAAAAGCEEQYWNYHTPVQAAVSYQYWNYHTTYDTPVQATVSYLLVLEFMKRAYEFVSLDKSLFFFFVWVSQRKFMRELAWIL